MLDPDVWIVICTDWLVAPVLTLDIVNCGEEQVIPEAAAD
jgi:hypothetical protein